MLARFGRALIAGHPRYRGPNGELADDEVDQHALPPWIWPEADRTSASRRTPHELLRNRDRCHATWFTRVCGRVEDDP
ncbi:hypothetical protein [Nocardia sp. NPDC050793]|uniref:hypothetical protein n=1 Tax=Nocardia sp. NPDC050793 TaxID=3155159 RepID=UPI0033CD2B22